MNDQHSNEVAMLYETFITRMNQPEMPPYVYTYPPKGAYRPFTDSELVKQAWSSISGSVALYVHVPFCNMKCHFCSLFQTTVHSEDYRAQYVTAVLKEFDMVTDYIESSSLTIDSIYLGGGTPTVLSDDQLSTLIKHFSSRFVVQSGAEVSIESTPDAVDTVRLRTLMDIGFNRISFGIQTFDEDELKSVGRKYGAQLGAQTVETAIEVGFPNVNLDLIYGLVGQTEERWMSNLSKALELRPQSITLYPLAVRRRTTFGTQFRLQPDKFSDEAQRYHYYDLAVEALTNNGYSQHTLVTFSRQDDGGNRHEANEFVGLPTIALGAGARSYAPTLHYTNDDYFQPSLPSATIDAYLKGIDQGSIAVRSGVVLDNDDSIRRYLILGLLYSGISRQQYSARFSETVESRFSTELDVLERAECITRDEASVRLTPLGRRFSSLVGDFLSSEGVKQRAAVYN